MTNRGAASPSGSAVFAGWRIRYGDAGRLWAGRERPFPAAAEKAGACRTVDGADLRELCRAIAEQEAIAEQAVREQENPPEKIGPGGPART